MLDFAKGHGTLNDFVLLLDPDDRLGLTDADVRFLCDRRAGIGGDGLLRAVRARHIPEWEGDPDLWFMDYRNADASIAEMCGNGLRVFVRFLYDAGLLPGESVEIGTRAGLKTAEVLPDGRIRLGMGRPTLTSDAAQIAHGGLTWRADAVDVGNPHAVALLADGQSLADLDLTHGPAWTPDATFPHGVNVEWVEQVAPGRVRMRVFERGCGETMSCGTGTVAVATAMAHHSGTRDGAWIVEVRGGEVTVELRDGEAWLTGPAVIVASGQVALPGRDA